MKRTPSNLAILIWGCMVIACSVFLLFHNLGHYALWGDEAGTALTAKAVLRTGDTSAFVDEHNILAYRNGAELKNLHLRYLPPLQFYLAAPFLKVMGEQSALAARLPFALCGLAGILLLLWWARREQIQIGFALLLGVGLLGNVSLFLYDRQSRYYAVAILCSIAIVYFYLHRDKRRAGIIALAIISICLLASNYLNYAALYLCLAVDYVLWGRREHPLTRREGAILLLPQLVIGAVIVSIWNPLSKHVVSAETAGWLSAKLTLFWWNWRDLDQCEFGALPLLALAPLLYIWKRDQWLVRAPLALLVYVGVVTILSPQPVSQTQVADVRYLVPIIPLCIVVEAMVLWTLAQKRAWLAVPLSLLVFGTNLFNGGPLIFSGFQSTIVKFAGEVVHPPADPFTVTAQWINGNVGDSQSVWVLPDIDTYPLMFHAPKAVYAWQLTDPPASQFTNLPAIHFQKRLPPDYLIAFGPAVVEMSEKLHAWEKPAGLHYDQVAVLDVYWQDLYRPELFWRRFDRMTNYDHSADTIRIFKRTM